MALEVVYCIAKNEDRCFIDDIFSTFYWTANGVQKTRFKSVKSSSFDLDVARVDCCNIKALSREVSVLNVEFTSLRLWTKPFYVNCPDCDKNLLISTIMT
jgi:hypothetical protein